MSGATTLSGLVAPVPNTLRVVSIVSLGILRYRIPCMPDCQTVASPHSDWYAK
jgi:hypothetical protein